MKPKVIKNEAEYEAALAYVYTLMDAEPGSQEEEELDLFTMLIEQYEQEHYPIAPPDTGGRNLFRMEQEGLTRKDLAAYIGSQSKVSEVLNRKRPLSLSMIRNLHEGLGIPADVLLQKPGMVLAHSADDYRCYPFAELLKRGYFPNWDGGLHRAKDYAEELLNNLFAPLGESIPQAVYCRRTRDEIDSFALAAWQALGHVPGPGTRPSLLRSACPQRNFLQKGSPGQLLFNGAQTCSRTVVRGWHLLCSASRICQRLILTARVSFRWQDDRSSV